MKIFQIIPAIDIIDGNCVRLTQGDYSQKKIYDNSPLKIAKQFENCGIQRLHLVDLDGAKQGKPVNLNVLEEIASQTKLVIDFGGGIKTEEQLSTVFDAGASIATIGSLAVKNKTLFASWIKTYGADKFLLGADVKEKQIAINGWLEQTKISVFHLIEENQGYGLNTIFCTDISKDGLLKGPSTELYKEILAKNPDLNLIASGGVSCIEDIYELIEVGCSGAIIGKAFYEGKITLNDLKQFL